MKIPNKSQAIQSILESKKNEDRISKKKINMKK